MNYINENIEKKKTNKQPIKQKHKIDFLNRCERPLLSQYYMYKKPANTASLSLKLLNFDDYSEIQRLFKMVKIYWHCFSSIWDTHKSDILWKSAFSFPTQILYDMAM